MVHLHGDVGRVGDRTRRLRPSGGGDPSTRISLPEVGLGLIPGAGGTVSLPRRIGRHLTLRLALDPVSIDADTALGWGLVDEVTL